MENSIVGLNTFKDARELIGYIDIHRETQRALVLYSHLVQLAYLAGFDISKIPKNEITQKNSFVSLNDYNTEKLISLAKERLKKGIISDGWKELFVLHIEENNKSQNCKEVN